jgi:hypothetical protein
MATRNLTEAILDGGIRSVNFFNGRLLSGEDLSQEQVANAEERKRLGQAIGDGIVNGLEVAPSTTAGNTGLPRVTVQPGLAINRLGQTLMLTSGIEISLVAPSTTTTTSTSSLFVTCTPPQSGPYVAGAGVYLLTIAPAFGFAGRAPVSALNVPGAAYSTCGSKDVVEGVKFGLVWLDINNLPGISDATRALLIQLISMTDLASLSKLRNLLAHLCFGTEQRAVLISDPFSQASKSPITDFGAIATLRSLGNLTDCDVPLALLYWRTDGLQFVDLGSVRRRPVPGPPSQSWPLALGGGYPAIGEAISIQFQEQITWLSASVQQTTPGQPLLFSARDSFRYLPPVGIIPVTGSRSVSGFVPLRFFDGIPLRSRLDDGSLNPPVIEGAKVQALIRNALSYPPIRLEDSTNSSNQEMVWIYQVRENQQAIASATLTPPQPYLIIISGHVPDRGDAQYDISHWSFGNYSSRLNP